ncbi:hypothetical protein FRACYDRAFT_211595 [Fragilariopsis cylindrus CCMP1102]|uniref:Helicase-associated domain-containing protein n=1 Tax=Fragilariopsis cylindrus CCMP1102 TaxID=635003 RepID=A0A1E7EXQ4_9STRA|nr:hypothetical protein FRACYDRAFT_211595 [Fragilariopsis cylindrus CCMP1102]|eukprot:OEU10818.1 hypothetical protein FRACYDRAFT_211595 [Fragilariopsis cylindrus CCMP1102]
MTRAKERSCALSNVSISKRYPKRQGDKKNYTFNERLAQLADYKEKTGDCNVPFDFKGYKNLGSWVSHQRQQYKLHKQNKSSSKMKERFCALEKLGFDFELGLRHTFNERLAQLADYKEKTGDCNVPNSFKGHNNLGMWVYNQRQQYKLHKQNKSSSKMKERFCALEKLDFDFERKLNHGFKERLAQLVDYKEKTGDCNVPNSFKGHKNLGRWVAHERQQYKLYKENKPNSMTKERICELEKINFGCRKTTNSRPWLSLLAQKENDDNKVVLVNPSFPTLVVPPAETVRSNNDIDEKDDDGNIYRTEEDTRDDNSEKDSGSGGWRDLSDDYYGSDDDNCLVF